MRGAIRRPTLLAAVFAAILGSVARSILRKSTCPVMVMNPVDFRSAV